MNMPTVEDVLDDLTLQASEIVSREDDSQIVIDLYNVISQKCENGDLLNELNGIERVFYLCQTFVLMMGSGGIETYYKEPSGNYANETVEALLEMNAKRTALILDRGNGIFHEGIVPENQQLRMEELKNLDYSEISWLFDLLDQEFLQLKEDLEMLNLNYVLNHKEAFM